MVKKYIFALAICLTFSLSFGQVLNPFFSIPLFNNNLFINGTANVVKAAPDQTMIVVGYSNGSVIGYNMNGNYINRFIGPTVGIKQLAWVPNIGPMSLDFSGMVYLWFKNGSLYATSNVGFGINKMSVTTSLSGMIYAAFSSNLKIVEYLITPNNLTASRTYTPPNGAIFASEILYSIGYNMLFTNAFFSNNSTYMLYSYSCFSGIIVNSLILPGTSYVLAFAPFTNGNYVMLLSNNQVYSFSTSLLPFSLGSTITNSQVMTTCLQGPYIVTAAISSLSLSPITIWNSFMSSQQVLNYPNSNVISMDCTGSYLVTLDSSNFLAVDSYITDADVTALVTLAGWIIGIIIGVAVLFIASIVICIVCCCCRRNKDTQLALNNTMGQELIITSPSPQLNDQYNRNYNGQYNQPFSGPSGQAHFQTNAYGNNPINPQY